MAERRVTKTGKDKDGDITKLCNPGEYWSPRSKQGAISDIEDGKHRYYVGSGSSKAYVCVVKGSTGKYLRTRGDSSSTSNLDSLPDC